jgi:hypothetical protein
MNGIQPQPSALHKKNDKERSLDQEEAHSFSRELGGEPWRRRTRNKLLMARTCVVALYSRGMVA